MTRLCELGFGLLIHVTLVDFARKHLLHLAHVDLLASLPHRRVRIRDPSNVLALPQSLSGTGVIRA